MAQYFYERYRNKLWKEQETKFLFMIKDELSINEYKIEEESSINIQEQSRLRLVKKLTLPKNTGNK